MEALNCSNEAYQCTGQTREACPVLPQLEQKQRQPAQQTAPQAAAGGHERCCCQVLTAAQAAAWQAEWMQGRLPQQARQAQQRQGQEWVLLPPLLPQPPSPELPRPLHLLLRLMVL